LILTWTTRGLVLFGVALPFLLLAVLGIASLVQRRLPAVVTGILTQLTCAGSLGAFVLAWPAVWAAPDRRVSMGAGTLFAVEDTAFEVDLFADPLSLWFAALTAALCGVVSAFSHRYMHREPGHNRFFVLLAAFMGGMLLVVLAGSIEVLFAGWELLGISSALLVAFFHERTLPVTNAMRVFVVYRIGDAAMLAAAVLVHHYVGSGDLALLLGDTSGGASPLSEGQATVVGALLLVAAAAKCAQIPFSSWLPRAMEGPTPSSAVFYGALSVHAGAYLLLRARPVIEQSPAVAIALGAMGLTTAVYASLVGRAQTDIKSALSYASLTQVSIILVEIALGIPFLPVLHMTGHACLRLLQFLRSPSLLHDMHRAEQSVGGHLAHTGAHFETAVPTRMQWWLYRFALERGHLDAWLSRLVVGPFQRAMLACDAWERALADRLVGGRDEPAREKPEAHA
jgi:NAD(P)H-quinone oxidoreductase subunit 5